MPLANALDETRDAAGDVVAYRRWPADRGGDIDDNGVLRPMSPVELAAWDAAEAEVADVEDRRRVRQVLDELRDMADGTLTPTWPQARQTIARVLLYLARQVRD